MEKNNSEHITQSEKWKFFKNYLHNELEITKADIRGWIEDAVKHQAVEMIQRSFEGADIDDLARVAISKEVRKSINFYQAEKEIISVAGKEMAKELLAEYKK
ncbi:hypothetical protein [Ilyobacter sp.]|jgi:SpoVK/Ycf46/Vps4 family AAA+-type ATPase|uniref:hypothetical protein n=1 Tax=Ilyobacter sp. TaxID=3100343 RepID=UPI0035686DEC